MIKVALMIKNKLINESIRTYLSSLPKCNFEIDGTSANTLSNPNIILFDPPSLKETKPEAFPNCAKLLLDTGLLEQELIFLILYYKLTGVFETNTPPELISKCLEVVSKGELWISKNLIKKLCNDLPIYSKRELPNFTPKEIQIIRLVKEGYSNIKIAEALSLSEHTVKCHLNRIFKKLGISKRVQLIKFFNDTSSTTLDSIIFNQEVNPKGSFKKILKIKKNSL